MLDFYLLLLADGENYSAATGEREFLAVLLGGKGNSTVQSPDTLQPLEVSGQSQGFSGVGGRPNVLAGKPHAVYMPCQY